MGDVKFGVEDGDIIQTIQESVKTEVIKDIGPEDFLSREVYLPPAPKLASALIIHTLQGVVDYLKSDRTLDNVLGAAEEGEKARSGLALHVVSHDRVEVISGIFGRFRQRETFIVAQASKILGNQFEFGKFYPLEQFNIYLRSLFVPGADAIDDILKLTSNLSVEDVEQWKDDGTSQIVIAKTGITKREEVTIPPTYTLQPYRTFRDVEQPPSDFILRLKPGSPPHAALFETDGGKWKLMAIQNVKRFLEENLEGVTVPIIA